MQALQTFNPFFESDSCKASSFAAEVETRRRDTAASEHKRFSFDQHTHRLIWTFRYRPSETAHRLRDRLIWRRNSLSITSLKSYNNPYAIRLSRRTHSSGRMHLYGSGGLSLFIYKLIWKPSAVGKLPLLARGRSLAFE